MPLIDLSAPIRPDSPEYPEPQPPSDFDLWESELNPIAFV